MSRRRGNTLLSGQSPLKFFKVKRSVPCVRQMGLMQWNRMCVPWGQTHLDLVQAIVLTDGASMPLVLKHLASSMIMYVQS